MSQRQTGETFELLCRLCGVKSRQTDLVVDHLLVLVALLQGGAKLHNIRVLRVVVLDKRATHKELP